MGYRNGTYVAFDGQGTTNPTESDIRYYGLLRRWDSSKSYSFTFSDSHEKTNSVRDTSKIETKKSKLLERMKNSKNMIVIISEDTNWDRGLLNYEIEKAVDYYKIPLIVAYTKYNSILNVDALKDKWPKALKERIEKGTAQCIHIPFKEKAILSAISQFSVHSQGENILTGSKHFYSKETHKNWGYID